MKFTVKRAEKQRGKSMLGWQTQQRRWREGRTQAGNGGSTLPGRCGPPEIDELSLASGPEAGWTTHFTHPCGCRHLLDELFRVKDLSKVTSSHMKYSKRPLVCVHVLQQAEEDEWRQLPNGEYTTAEVRPNAYIPHEALLPLPKPYGAQAPFKPSQPGAAMMRHARKPQLRPLESETPTSSPEQ